MGTKKDVFKAIQLKGQTWGLWLDLSNCTIALCNFKAIYLIFINILKLIFEHECGPHQILGGYAS